MASTWISDCGRVRAWRRGEDLEVSVEGELFRLSQTWASRRLPSGWGKRRWLWVRCPAPYSTEAIIAVEDGVDFVIAHVVCKLLALGGPDDPRMTEAEYRCAPVLEVA